MISTTAVTHNINDSYVLYARTLKHHFSYTGPGKPTNVNVQAISCDKLMVTWGTPNQTGGLPIVGYSVTTGSTVTSFSTKQTALIIDHQPGTEYTITVQARNVIGQGLPVEKTGSPQARGTTCLQTIYCTCIRFIQYVTVYMYCACSVSITCCKYIQYVTRIPYNLLNIQY